MELQNGFVQILATITTLVGGGAGVWASVNLAKKIKFVPIDAGQKNLLIGVAGVLSAVAVALLALASGEALPASLQEVMVKLLELASVWAVAHTTHMALKK